MSYIDEINAFERWLGGNHLPGTSQLLWYKLMALCNGCGWAEWFSVDNRRLMMMIDTNSNGTVIRARDKLIEAGLLEYRKGKKGSPGKYHLVSVSNTVLYRTEYGTEYGLNTGRNMGRYVEHINRIDKNRQDKKIDDDVGERARAREEIPAEKNSDIEEAIPEWVKVTDYYKAITHREATPNRAQLIDSYIKDGAEVELICALLDYAVENDKRNVWRYTETALMSCMDRGIYTLAAYRQEQAERKQERGRSNDGERGKAASVVEAGAGAEPGAYLGKFAEII